MKKIAFAFIVAALSLFADANDADGSQLHYILISPPVYTTDWQAYLDMRKEQRPDVAFTLKNATEIYRDYPFKPDAVGGLPRNPAESIHAWIRAQMAGIADPTERAKYYFVLGGSFTDAQTITASDDARLERYIPGVYVRPRFAPDANIQVGEPYYSISDMFYACLDVKDGEWPWDANKNGKYADNQEAGTELNDYRADVIVSRIPIEKHPSASGKDVIAAFKAKVARVEDEKFAGKYRFALAGGQCSNKDGRINVSDSRTLRDEHEFYDGGLNMFDPRHGGIWVDSELVPRQTVKNTTVNSRPVLEGNPMFIYTWGAEHPSIDEAVAHFYSHDYDYMEYRDHGSASDLYCKYINVDAYLKAKGLTRMIISGFSCMTGYIDGPGISLAEAEILSPYGGTVASVHNSRYGVNWAGTDLKDNAGLSSTLQYLIKQGVLEKNMDIGQAWLYARQQFGATADQALFVSAEQLLLGDPLIKLPPAIPETTLDETEIVVTKDTGYTTLNVKGDTTISGGHLFKVMQGLNVTTAGDLTFAADGGVGGSGVVFENGNGVLTIASPKKSYFTPPSGAARVALEGSGTVLDFGNYVAAKDCEFNFCGKGGSRSGNVLRGRAEGQLKNLLPLSIENTEVALGSVDAFRGAENAVFGIVRNGALGITFNPNYGLENSWEYFSSQIDLNYSSLFVDRTTTAGFGRPDKPGLAVYVNGDCSVKTKNNGRITLFGTTSFNLGDSSSLTLDAVFKPDADTMGNIEINGGRTIVSDSVGISGDITVNSGNLVLKEIPLKNVTKLTLRGNSKLILPKDESGFYQILPSNGASLELDGASIYTSENPDKAISGELTTTCAFFDATKFLVWNVKGSGTWNLEVENMPWKSGEIKAAYTAGMKVCFPDIPYSTMGQVHEIKLSEEINCEYAYFGNRNQKYKFSGERLYLKNLQVGTEVQFDNEVYSSSGAVALEGAKLKLRCLNSPSLSINRGASVEADIISRTISEIRGFRFVPLDTAQSGNNKLSISELEFSNVNGKINLGQAIVSEPSGIGATSTNMSKAWDGDVIGMNFQFNGQQPWSVTFDDSSVMTKGEYYLQFMFDSPIPMIKSYRIGATFNNQRVESVKSWRIDVTIDGESWVSVSQVDEVSYPGAGFGELWVNSGNAFSVSSDPTDISVEEGGMLALKGDVDANITLAEGANLKVVRGAELTLGKGSKIVLPEEGFAYIDCSEVDLTDNSEPLTILSGLTLTEDDLAHLTTCGKPWMKLELFNGSLTLSLDKKPPKVLFR